MASLIRDLAASTPEMLAAFGDDSLLHAALDFETALARAQAAEGLFSAEWAETIAATCKAVAIDPAALAEEAAHAGTLAIPLIRRLRVAVAEQNPAAAKILHRGATSQDVADTALMLQAKAGAALIERDLLGLCANLARLAKTHAATPMIGRTLLQGALPITFGLKAANWLLGVDAALTRFRRERDNALVLQFGGAAGSLAGLDGKGAAIAGRLAADLGLSCPPIPWQARRDGIAGLGAALGIVTGAVGKIARDVSLMAQGEVAEAFEPRQDGRGGSSAMAHKRNPTGCQVALSATLRTPGLVSTLLSTLVQEHERGLGGWQAEGPVLSDLFQSAHGAIVAMAPVVEGLDVDVSAMARNLDAAGIGGDLGEAGLLVGRALDHHRRES